jgi:DNA polymerase-4
MERFIIHLNVADFAVAVERVVDRRLRDRPLIIAPEGASRARVFDMSEEAYRCGVRKDMALRRAQRRCPDAAVLPPHADRYERAMADLFKRALPYSPLIEPGEADGHLFIDVSGTSRLFGPPVDVAWRLHRQIKADLALNPIWSLGPNKLVAKVASRLVKPSGEYVVGAGEEEPFLSPLPVWLVPGIEGGDVMRLKEFNLTRVFQVRALTLTQLQVPFGKRAAFIQAAMRGIDASPVLPVGQKAPAVRIDHEFGDDTNDRAKIEGVLYRMVEQAGHHLRCQPRAARRMGLSLGYSDGLRCVRQVSIAPATANDLTLFEFGKRVLSAAWMRRVRVRHMRLVCDRLVFPPAQLSLFEPERRKEARRERLIAAIDEIRRRFGPGAVAVGRTLAA